MVTGIRDIHTKMQHVSYIVKESMVLLVTSQELQAKISWLFLGTSCILTTTFPFLGDRGLIEIHPNFQYSSFPNLPYFNTIALMLQNSQDCEE